MRCACVDIGSNTTRLLVAEVDAAGCHPLRQERAFTRLGAALGSDERVTDAKIAEVARVVGEHVAQARALGTRRIAVIGTAALRRAANRDELCAAIARAGGVEPRILEAAEEARLAFAGATLGVSPGPQRLVVIDVGGGSTEVVAGRLTPAGPVVGRLWSLPVGSGVLTDRVAPGDPPTPEQIARLRDQSARALAVIAGGGAVDRVLAAGGSASSLGRVLGTRLHARALSRALAALCAAPAAEVAAALGLHPERVRLLPAGLVLLEAAAGHLGSALEVASGGVREGAVCRLAAAGPGGFGPAAPAL